MYICGSYVWGEDSPVYNTINVDLFDILENDVSYYSELGSVFVTGDLNSRTSNKCDFIVYDSINTVLDDFDYIPDQPSVRASIDTIHNNHGIKLLDLCKSTTLRIVNGRIGDSCKQTFFSSNGSSVIDYLLTNECNFPLLSQFTVGEFNEWSDHAPLHFSLFGNNCLPSYETFTDVKYKWDSSRRDEFRSRIISKLPIFNDIVRSIDNSNQLSINSIIDKFTATIRSEADELFSKSYKYSNKPSFNTDSSLKHADWFDNECITARNHYHDALKYFNLNMTDLNRKVLCENKSVYKKLIMKKKNIAYQRKMAEIESLKSKKPKDFWKLFKSKNKSNCNKIPLDVFKEYFENLSNTNSDNHNAQAEFFCSNNDFDIENCTFPE